MSTSLDPERERPPQAGPNRAAADRLRLLLARGTTPVLVRSPPGAGKTGLVAEAAAGSASAGERVCAVTATNNQAGELATRTAGTDPDVQVVLLLGHTAPIPDTAAAAVADGLVMVTRTISHVPPGPVVVASSSAKWMCHPRTDQPPYDLQILEEAYMQPWHATFPLANLARRHLAVGDPGQTAPFAATGQRRWRGQPLSPLTPAAEALERLHPHAPVILLDTSLRLPADTCDVLQPLYPDLPFRGLAQTGQRVLISARRPGPAGSRFLALISGRSIARLDLPGSGGPLDPDLCRYAGRLATELTDAGLTAVDTGTAGPPRPATIAVVCARTRQVAAVRSAVTGRAASAVVVDTANRLQGLEYDVVLAVDPLAGHNRLGPFVLEAGRLSVMLSRHHNACGLLTRPEVALALARHVPTSDRVLGHDPDAEHQGRAAHAAVRGLLHP